MFDGTNEAPKLTRAEEDLDWLRGLWNEAGEKLAKKLTKDTGVEHTLTDAMEIIANDTNVLIDMYESPIKEDGSAKTEAEIEEDKVKADFLRGRRYHQND